MRTTKKRFERGADICTEIPKGTLLLVEHEVYLDDSEILYEQREFSQEILERDFDVKSGEWYAEDGWVVGKNPLCRPGILVSKDDYFGNNMLELTCKMVDPSTHDINVMLNGSWHPEKDCRHVAYVAGLEAFWHGNVGFEKSPEYKLVISTSLFDFDPAVEHKLQFGNINGQLFILVDGKIALEIQDPDPIDVNKYGKIGFEAFSSWWKFKDVCVKKLKYRHIKKENTYVSEF